MTHYRVCNIDGCDESLEGRHWRTKYCCSVHRGKAYDQTPKGKASNSKRGKAYAQSPKGKAALKANRERPEVKAKIEAYTHGPEAKARMKAYTSSPKGRASRRNARQKRRARKAKLEATLTIQEWQQTLRDFNYRCAYCGAEGNIEQDHFVPLTMGGAYSRGNILPACRSCNGSKHSRDPQDYLASRLYERLKKYLTARENGHHLPTACVYNRSAIVGSIARTRRTL